MKKKAKKNDRNGKNKSAKKSGHHRPGNANGKVRSNAGGDRPDKRTPAPSKGGEKTVEEALPPKPKAKEKAAATVNSKTHDELLIDKAQRWAELHAKPDSRGEMDKVFTGLSADDARRVRLCGQRIAGGLSIKLVK